MRERKDRIFKKKKVKQKEKNFAKLKEIWKD